MAGLPLSPALINQNWGDAVYRLAQALAECKGINDMIADTNRLPPGGAAGLEAVGVTVSDAGLLVAGFGDLAALYRVGHGQQQQVGNSNFFFNAAGLLGTKPLPL
jgi:hypothetical protein